MDFCPPLSDNKQLSLVLNPDVAQRRAEREWLENLAGPESSATAVARAHLDSLA